MTAPTSVPMDLENAYRQLSFLPLDARTRELFHNQLKELNQASDAESLRLSLAETRGLMRGIGFAQILPTEVVAKVTMLCERFALAEFDQVQA